MGWQFTIDGGMSWQDNSLAPSPLDILRDEWEVVV
jgi:hypothetical protein